MNVELRSKLVQFDIPGVRSRMRSDHYRDCDSPPDFIRRQVRPPVAEHGSGLGGLMRVTAGSLPNIRLNVRVPGRCN